MSTTPPAAPPLANGGNTTTSSKPAAAKKSGKKLIDGVHVVSGGKTPGITIYPDRTAALEKAIVDKADVTAVKFGETIIL